MRVFLPIAARFCVLVLAGLTPQASQAQDAKEEKIVVRPLKFTPKDPALNYRIGGQSKTTTLADPAAVKKLVGTDNAKALLDLVDFQKEKLVLVSWTTSGPPDGTLQHEFKGTGKDPRLIFFVQGPPGANARGQRARLGANFFAVPRNVDVSFDPKER